MKKISLYSPFIGAVVKLEQVPDLVFADKLVGDGVAIEPFDCHIYAPLDSVVKSIHNSLHAITLLADDNIEVLLHIGLDTVELAGKGFELDIKVGDKVKRGQILGKFDLDLVARQAKSLLSPVLIMHNGHYHIEEITAPSIITTANTVLFTIAITASQADTNQTQVERLIASTPIKIRNLHGIHARPAALISNEANKYVGSVVIEKSPHRANAKSVVELLSLAVNHDDEVIIHAANKQIITAITDILNQLHDENNQPLPMLNNSSTDALMGEVIKHNYMGMVAAHGITIGKLLIKQNVTLDITETATDIDAEHALLVKALKQVEQELEQIVAQHSDKLVKDIFATHLALLRDTTLLDGAIQLINQHKTALYAFKQVIDDKAALLIQSHNQLLAERQADFHDIYKRVASAISGVSLAGINSATPAILVAHELTPLDMLNLTPNIVGLVTVTGGTTSHVAILARAKQIPLLIGVHADILKLTGDIDAILDTYQATLNTQPSVADMATAEDNIRKQRNKQQLHQQAASAAAVTTDGVEIKCLANIASIDDAKQLASCGASGVGLFRTEFMYMHREFAPTILEQQQIYTQIAQLTGNAPLVMRTLDGGGDKPLSYLAQAPSSNVLLGVRGIRLSLANRQLLIEQLTAILALEHKQLKIMLPMITTLDEYRSVKQLLAELSMVHNSSAKIELGIMVEVPAVVLQSEIFAKEVDFFSIGTNDLSQYVLAMDRENIALAAQVDYLHPALLKSIQLVVNAAVKYNRTVSVCGMMASEQLALPLLIGLGITELSMDIPAIAANKALIRRLELNQCKQAALQCVNFATAAEVRAYLMHNFSHIISEGLV